MKMTHRFLTWALALTALPVTASAQGYQVYSDRQAFLSAASQVVEKIRTDDFSSYPEGELHAQQEAEHQVNLIDYTRVYILEGIDPSIVNPSSPARETRVFIDDVTTQNQYSAGIWFGARPETPGAARHLLRPVEVDAQRRPISPYGELNSGIVRFFLAADRVYGFGVELEGVTRQGVSKMVVRYFASGTDVYLDIPPSDDGRVFIGFLSSQPFNAVQLWIGSRAVGESVGVASVTTAFTDPVIELGCPGDTNGDGIVNLADLNAILSNFGDRSGRYGLAGGDVNGDHEINLHDLNIILAHFGVVGCDDPDGGGGDGGGDGGGGGGDGGGGDGGGGDGGGGDGGGGDPSHGKPDQP